MTPNVPENTIHLAFLSGRSALSFAVEHFILRQNVKILVPAIICSDVIDILESFDICIIFYPILPNFNVDWLSLSELVKNHNPDAILAVNYFDQCTELPRIKIMCDKHNMIMIEDNCHGLEAGFKSYNSSQVGDILISSPRKILKTPSGGYLRIKPHNFINSYTTSEFRQRFCMPKISLLIKYFILNHSPYLTKELRKRKQIMKYQDSINTRQFNSNYGEIDIFSYVAMKCSLRRKLVEKRKKNWMLWNSFLSRWGAVSVFGGIKEGSCPWALPFVLPDPTSSELFAIARNKGIPLFRWPDSKSYLNPDDNIEIYCVDLLHEPDWYV